MALDPRPTAVFAFSDELAAGALAGAYEAGLRVPDDVSIIGVDGHPIAETLDLSSVDQDVAAQGRRDRRAGAGAARRARDDAVGDGARPAGGPAAAPDPLARR